MTIKLVLRTGETWFLSKFTDPSLPQRISEARPSEMFSLRIDNGEWILINVSDIAYAEELLRG